VNGLAAPPVSVCRAHRGQNQNQNQNQNIEYLIVSTATRRRALAHLIDQSRGGA